MFKVQVVATHIITGFLGAGKTTLLRHLLNQKPEKEVWAVLMNEFGQIGIDQTWVAENQGIAVREVLGGCLCCTSQLPMQIALARLLSEYKPQRLFIEPTGLGHPKELIEQLSQPHWQNSLSLREVITVLDGHRLHEQLWHKHEIFLQQIDVADMVVVSHHAEMSQQDQDQLRQLQHAYVYPEKKWVLINQGNIELSVFDQPRQRQTIRKQTLLSQRITKMDAIGEETEPKTLPYHYAIQQQGYHVAGWHLPKSWQFDVDRLMVILQQLKDCERIKGKLQTDQGWIDINAIPNNFQVDFSAKAGLDNRLEVISSIIQDWSGLEERILKAQIP